VTFALFEGLARFVVRFRVLVAVFWLVVMAVALLALPSLGSEANSDPSLFLSSSARSVKAADLGTPLLGSTSKSKITIVAARAGGPLTQADLAAIAREARLADQVKGVASVKHLRGLAAAGNGSISPDSRALQFPVDVDSSNKDVTALKIVVNALHATFAKAGAPPGLQLHLAGQVASNAANNASGNKATGKIGLYSILFIIVLLLIVLRSPVAALATFVPSLVALLVSERFIAGLGADGLQISSITQTLLVVLILGAGTDYGLFLVYRFREELRAGVEPRDAVVHALTRVGESISASAGTVILALLTLLLAGFGLYHDMGVPLALGVAVMLLAGLTLLPALLAMFAGVVFPAAGRNVHDPATCQDAGLWGRVAARGVRRPGLVLGCGVLIFAGLALAVLGYRTASLGRSTTAPAGSDAAAGNAILSEYFPQTAVSPAHLVLSYRTPVWQHPDSLAAAGASLRSSGLFAVLAGPLNEGGTALSPTAYDAAHSELGDPRLLPLEEPAGLRMPRTLYNAYRASAQYVSADGRTVQFLAGLRAGNEQSTAAMDATPAVRAAVAVAARRSGATENGVASVAASLYDVSQTAGGDMVRIIPVAALAIAILLGLVLRSLVAPVYLVVSILLSYLAALGATTLLVVGLGGQDGLIFVLPFLMFIFLLALGEDYNILIMTRIREEARHLPVREAVVQAIGRTGPTVTSAGLILAGTFAVFALASGGVMGGQLRWIGLGLALGVLMDTFVVRTLLVPSAAVLLGRWNWWPSRLGRRGSSAVVGVPARSSEAPGT
jgi:RND superfamily putative drug exporter